MRVHVCTHRNIEHTSVGLAHSCPIISLPRVTRVWEHGKVPDCVELCSSLQGAPKDVQQLFTAIDRRVEALRRNAEYSQEGSESQQEAGTRPDSQNVSFDEDDKESFLDDPHSSPDSSPDAHSHARRLRQVENPVSIPEQQSVPIPDLPGSDNEEQDASSNKDLSSGKESPTVETESGIDSTSV